MLQVGAIGEKEGWTSSGMGSAARGEREGLSIVITVSITGFVYNLIIVRKKIHMYRLLLLGVWSRFLIDVALGSVYGSTVSVGSKGPEMRWGRPG